MFMLHLLSITPYSTLRIATDLVDLYAFIRIQHSLSSKNTRYLCRRSLMSQRYRLFVNATSHKPTKCNLFSYRKQHSLFTQQQYIESSIACHLVYTIQISHNYSIETNKRIFMFHRKDSNNN